ncbi:acetylcholine receptor subunit beta-like 1 isoform X3 [Saccostrea echinata]|uniref:acetylcholine receptor subunit beta-like 1 isoform X3 n=1 Tax=Saccostrea echinata TaxID=191078 RepID=UPI002A832D65|nr:acetylcholine receptor subunit beta-like 1 isoform X3 [Saccostrea echinata]
MFLLLVILFGSALGLGSDDEVKLIEYLFVDKNYNPLIRPVRNINESIEVQFNLALSQLISVDEKNQIMKTNVWLQMYWYDYQLTWNPDKYGGIKTIRINHSKAWRPDIVLFNNADGKYEVSYESNILLSYDSLVYWIPPAIYKSSCTIDVQFFPFDQQICEMKFGSWTFTDKQLNFTFYNNMNSLDFTDYLKSGSWDIIAGPGRITTEIDPGSNLNKAMVIFEFHLRRKTLFYTVNLIIPCILISFVSVCVFLLPADACEKITLCISILLALVVFLLLISKILPPSLQIPLIAHYLLFTFIMNILAICLTVFVINKNFRTPRTHQMPNWIRVVFLNYLPRLLLMTRPNHMQRWQKPLKEEQHEGIVINQNNVMKSNNFSAYPPNYQELTEMHRPECRRHNNRNIPEGSPLLGLTRQTVNHLVDNASQNKPFKMTPELREATEALKFITEHLKAEDEYDTVLDDWKFVASVLDRLLLIVFLTVTIFGSIGILMQAPYILQYVDQDEIIRKLMGKYMK